MNRTDFFSLEEADCFIESSFFGENEFSFDVMLNDGRELIKEKRLESSQKYLSDSMPFALDISIKDLGYYPSR